jgi:hypothetical protein
MVWLHLGAQLTVYAAEINVVVARKLWPRSLFGDPDQPADQKTLRALAKVEERSPVEQVDVQFEPPAGKDAPVDESEQAIGGVAPGHPQRP